MDGLARTSGQLYQELVIGGKTYTLRPPAMTGLYGKMEAYIIAQRVDPLVLAATACKTAPKEQHDAIWQAAMKVASKARTVEATEMAEFENSVKGLAFKFWACLQEKHAQDVLTPDDALRLLEEAGDERIGEILAKVHVASGQADLGNSSGPSPKARAEESTISPKAE
jgi:hypothetical protein